MWEKGWRIGVFLFIAIWPLYWWYAAASGTLGADPGKALVSNLGNGALILLLATLLMSPLHVMTKWQGWIDVRRQLGLWCFTYAVLHIVSYIVFIALLKPGNVFDDMIERPYILVGLFAFLGLLVMALTSNHFSVEKLGDGWKKLHKIIYLVLGLVLIHMLWVVRSDLTSWLGYVVIAAILIFMRWNWLVSLLTSGNKKKN